MTTIRTYRCNLCGTTKTDPKFISGIYFGSGLSGDKIEFRAAPDAENHLCDSCIKGLADSLCPRATS